MVDQSLVREGAFSNIYGFHRKQKRKQAKEPVMKPIYTPGTYTRCFKVCFYTLARLDLHCGGFYS